MGLPVRWPASKSTGRPQTTNPLVVTWFLYFLLQFMAVWVPHLEFAGVEAPENCQLRAIGLRHF